MKSEMKNLTVMAMAATAAATALAGIEVKSSSVTCIGPATADEVSAAREKLAAGKVKPEWASISLRNVDDATFEAMASAFPVCRQFKLDKSAVTTLAPFAKLASVKTIEIVNCDAKDLSPLAKVDTVEEISLYGSTVENFSPLAACPRLRSLNYYATKAAPEVYDTLGALTQVKVFHGGLSAVRSLEWLKRTPNVEELHVFDEAIADFSPVSSLSSLRKFRAWNMNGAKVSQVSVPELGDVSFLAKCRALEILELPGCAYTNLASLAGLRQLKRVVLTGARKELDLSFLKECVSLEMLDASDAKAGLKGFDALAGHAALRYCNLSESRGEIDVSFAKTCPAVATLNLSGRKDAATSVANFDALAGAPSLTTLDLRYATGVSLAALRECPKLANVSVMKGAFPADEVKALADALQANNKRARVIER